jgi:drug/metabolite transporter (DMT)-like permease
VTRKLPWQVWAALAIVYVVWGSTYFAIRIVVRSLPPLYSAGARFAVAGLILLAIAAATRGLHGVTWRGVLYAAVPGVLLTAGGNGAVMLAERTLESSIAALIVALAPVLMAIMTMGLDRRLVRPRAAVGLALGFIGLVLLIRPQPGGHVDLTGAAIMLLATVSWAAGSVFAARKPTGMSAPATAGFQMLLGGAALALGGLLFQEPIPTSLPASAYPSAWALLYLVVFGSLVGFSAYSWLLSRAPISLVSTYAYVNPVVAIALGVLFLQEGFGMGEVIASAIILAGVALIVSAPQRPKEEYFRASAAAAPQPSPSTGGGHAQEPSASRAAR